VDQADLIGTAAPRRRTDAASRLIAASPEAIYDAFVDRHALEQWLPPAGMTARALEFDPCEGGRYRIELTLTGEGQGKTTGDTDVAQGAFLELDPGRRIVWSAEFVSDDPAFAGTMIMTWSLDPRGAGTEVTIIAENVPPGISKVDHDVGLNSTLANLARFVGG
jgi:uncharacterized protein YndB with AHSA1/START domain